MTAVQSTSGHLATLKQAYGRLAASSPRRSPRGRWSARIALDIVALTCVVTSGLLQAIVVINSMGAPHAHGFTAAAAAAMLATYAVLASILVVQVRQRFDISCPSTDSKWLAACSGFAAALAISLHGHALPSNADILVLVGQMLAASLAAPALVRYAFAWSVQHFDLVARFRRQIAIYGISEHSDALVRCIRSESSRADLLGLFDDRKTRHPHGIANTRSGGFTELIELIRRGAVDDVIIALPRSASGRCAEIVERLRGYPVDVHLLAHFVDPAINFDRSAAQFSTIGEAALLRIHKKPIRDWSACAKELLDRGAAGALLVLLAPLFALIAIAIKLDSRGPVFFRQRRHGVSNNEIVVWKFRSMTVSEDGSRVQQASKGDSRITRVGSILRRTSLDELPQLVNVVLGDMSLVGPRPHAVAHNQHYARLVDCYDHRAQVKPGITGWAQVNGFRGETTHPSLMAQRIRHDIDYIRNWSLWLDIKILLLTPIYGLVHKNAY